MAIKITDEFLPQQEFSAIQKTLTSEMFPWYYINSVVEGYRGDVDDFFFCHVFYNRMAGQESPFLKILKPIIKRLDVRKSFFSRNKLLRAKANLYHRTERLVYHPPHIDFEVPNYSCLFYINSNNGLTVVGENREIESVENRLVIFDGSQPHHSTSTTNEKMRININFNFDM